MITWPLFVCFKLGHLLIGGALFDNRGSSNQELAELVTNKEWPNDQLTALIYYVYLKFTYKRYNIHYLLFFSRMTLTSLNSPVLVMAGSTLTLTGIQVEH